MQSSQKAAASRYNTITAAVLALSVILLVIAGVCLREPAQQQKAPAAAQQGAR